jgi:hypothetical protein
MHEDSTTLRIRRAEGQGNDVFQSRGQALRFRTQPPYFLLRFC